jgi:hypothetical protein
MSLNLNGSETFIEHYDPSSVVVCVEQRAMKTILHKSKQDSTGGINGTDFVHAARCSSCIVITSDLGHEFILVCVPIIIESERTQI